MSNNKEYEALKIGALLHDIGKFVQRSSDKPKSKKHEEFSYEFLKRKFEEGFLSDLDKKTKNKILEIVKEHHNSSIKTDLVGIVRLADWLSSGERKEPKGDFDEILITKEQKLLSIFETVYVVKNLDDKVKMGEISEEEKEKILNKIYDMGFKYSLKPLNVSDAIFTDKRYPNEKYEDLFNEFEDKIDEFKENVSFEELYQLIQKYTWCVPSVTIWKKSGSLKGGLPDVSLFDHSKTTCAIACCLYHMYIKNEHAKEQIDDEALKKLLNNKEDEWKKPIFSLIHGDLSGIQDFVFTITTKYATKSLKGRSFYLDFLTEYFAKYICKRLNLPITNILFYGGGHFYILSYKVDDNFVEEVEREINEKLFEMFRTKIYITIAKVDISPNSFKKKEKDSFTKKWKEVSEKTVEKKLKRFKFKLEELFEPYNRGSEDRCVICRKEIDIVEDEYFIDKTNKICKYCASFVALTDILKHFQINNEIKFNDIYPIPSIDEKFSFLTNPAIKELEEKFSVFSDENYFLERYNLPHEESGELIIPYKIWGIAFPINEDENEKRILDFDELAEKAEERTGTRKIGILKMDVDNLGEIFTNGLGSFATISRMSTLSSMLTLFFTGYIPHLIKNEEFEVNGKKYRFKDNIYLVYAGGDDTLIVGAWDAIWELAKRIRDDFKRFVCYNPYITVSAGIVFVNPKFEFKKAVNMAEEELESGKNYTIYEDEENEKKIDKNALTVFSCSMNWDFEIKYNEDFWNKLMTYMNNGYIDFGEVNEEILKLKELVKEFNEDKLEKKFEEAIEGTKKKRILHIAQITGGRLENVIKKEGEIIINLPYYWRVIYYLHRNYKDDEREYVEFLEDYVKEKVKKLFSSKIKLNFNDLKVSSKIVELKKRNR
ncbi:CRISPR-associated protein, Csm1 family [Methanocaldococcus bathoardescens]|uniref:CRISPR system single-strand-specific deoxyribonuclease Cas10/Csm1 (subtype III-A) n=1 Tax=Methanocaldococcus bathoardescens TaxID=1301915 RepID=A0A076LDM8_9EURY|nr:type III-A CRISPR-associated protein Cas10/Csm1 [Methanocaldococcus bathoardescens]AIJ06331.1 CRISPR-associated protein, Csm1 family [Methanocaldococcus bathoardescens]